MRNLKKIIAVFFVAIMAMSFSGCMQVIMGVTVNEDGSAVVKVSYGYFKSHIEKVGLAEDDAVSRLQEALEASSEGYEFETFSNDKYCGVTMSRSLADLKELDSDELTEGIVINYNTEGKKSFSMDVPITAFTGEMNEMGMSVEALAGIDGAEFKITITFPYEVGENNATEVSEDKKTVTWDIITFKEDSLKVVAKEPSSPVLLIVIIAAAVVVVAVVVILVGKNCCKKKAAREAAEAAEAAAREAAEAAAREAAEAEAEVEPAAQVAETPVEDAPTEEPAAQVAEVPVEDAPTEEAAAQVAEVPVEDAPTEEAAAQVVETPVEDAPTEEPAAQVAETPVEDAPTEEPAAQVVETPVEDAPGTAENEAAPEAPTEE